MADYDRVRYAQGAEPPLSFDRRAPAPRGGPAPVTLILSLLLLVGVGGGVFYMYRSGLRGPGDAPRPVGAPIGQVRTAAPPQAATPDPGAGLTIYKDDVNGATAVPAFVPPPEQPSPRPVTRAPTAPPAPLSAPMTAKALPPASAIAGTKPSAPTTPATHEVSDSAHEALVAPPRSALASPSTTEKSVPATAATAKTLQPTHAKAKTSSNASIDSILADPASASVGAAKSRSKAIAKDAPAKTAADGGDSADTKANAEPKTALAGAGKPPVVQIGAYSSRDLAEAGWSAAAGAAPKGMSGKVKHVVPLSKADGTKLYRTSVTGFASRDEAVALCAKLKAGGQSCFVR